MDEILFSQKHTKRCWGEQIHVCCYVPIIEYCTTNAPTYTDFLNSEESESSSNWLNIWKVKRDEKRSILL